MLFLKVGGTRMYRIGRFLAGLSLVVALLLPLEAAAATPEALQQTINHLLQYVERSKCVFIRNGKEYDSKEAAEHIKAKYDAFVSNIKTPEEFIERIASQSMLNDRPYFVRCGDHSLTPSADWLTKELSNYRK